MLITVDVQDSTPLNEQIVSCVRTAIDGGSLTIGDRLPSARELAASLGINMHTVLRAYQSLRDMQLIELRRGRGAVVTVSADPDVGDVREKCAQFLAAAKKLGMRRDQVMSLIDEMGT